MDENPSALQLKLSGPVLECNWQGPFCWTGFCRNSDVPPLPKHRGVYLQTVSSDGGFIVLGAGYTLRPVHQRFAEHLRNWMKGEYTVFDIESIRMGERREIWHGWG
jgi:hypothetical protein